MSDLFSQRRNRRSPLVLVGSAVFALLAVVSAVDALRGAAPLASEGALTHGDATTYRIVAAVICALIAVWIFVGGGPRRDDRPSLLR
jgi:hypothetical protein